MMTIHELLDLAKKMMSPQEDLAIMRGKFHFSLLGDGQFCGFGGWFDVIFGDDKDVCFNRIHATLPAAEFDIWTAGSA
jgi:hypothetical protein